MNLFGVTENDLTLPRRLDAPRQDVTWSRHTTLVVAGLLALALVPRAIMAWKLDTICSDGPLYIYLAKALEAGNFGTAFGRMGINPYPVALAALHHLGLDWETAGKVWGVSLATLCVLPIFGLLRRQFSDGVAVLACVLYAVHPKLIEWSPELIRDQTYWFLFATAAYLLWRAVSEARPWLFVPAAVVSALSVMTRFEGAFLCAAWVAWIGWRLYLSDAEARRRIGFGLVLSLVCLPGLLIALSLIFARHSGVELLGLAPARRVVEFVGALFDGSALAATDETPRMDFLEMNWVYLDAMQRGIGPAFSVLMFGGILAWWRTWLRAEHQGLFWYGVIVGGGAWIHVWHTQEISSRYALSISVLGGAFAALGLVSLSRGFGQVLAKASSSWSRPLPAARTASATFTVVLLAVATVGLADALTSGYESRQARAAVGHLIGETYGSEARIVGSAELGALVGYYADAKYVRLPRWPNKEALEESIAESAPEVVAISVTEYRKQELLDATRRLGYVQVEGLEPLTANHIHVYVRAPDRVGTQPALVAAPASGAGATR